MDSVPPRTYNVDIPAMHGPEVKIARVIARYFDCVLQILKTSEQLYSKHPANVPNNFPLPQLFKLFTLDIPVTGRYRIAL